jgi:hypothetical protein
MANDWTVTYGKHQIRVEKTTYGARLHADGELLDTTNDLCASEDEPTLVGVFDNKMFWVEAFVKPSATQESGDKLRMVRCPHMQSVQPGSRVRRAETQHVIVGNIVRRSDEACLQLLRVVEVIELTSS